MHWHQLQMHWLSDKDKSKHMEAESVAWAHTSCLGNAWHCALRREQELTLGLQGVKQQLLGCASSDLLRCFTCNVSPTQTQSRHHRHRLGASASDRPLKRSRVQGDGSTHRCRTKQRQNTVALDFLIVHKRYKLACIRTSARSREILVLPNLVSRCVL